MKTLAIPRQAVLAKYLLRIGRKTKIAIYGLITLSALVHTDQIFL